MKRSEINAIMLAADKFIRSQGFHLPPFAYWTPEDWQSKGAEVEEIVTTHLGWDITDFGSGNFQQCGLFLFTLRNGKPSNWDTRSGKLYAEKIMVVEDGQITPMHFHWTKMEDIINRGGGKLVIQLFNATANEELDNINTLQVSIDSSRKTLTPGEIVSLAPGESITLAPYCYHAFWGEGRVLVGEVSLINDDSSDNRFHQAHGRYPDIIEDVPPLHLLCTDYEKYYHQTPPVSMPRRANPSF
jgi:D-lyxose ketol-isomerase